MTSIRAGRLDRLRVVGVVRGPADLLPPRTSQFALVQRRARTCCSRRPGSEANGPDVGSYGDLHGGRPRTRRRRSRTSPSRSPIASVSERSSSPPTTRSASRPRCSGRWTVRSAPRGGPSWRSRSAVAVVATLLFALAMSRQLAAEGADRRPPPLVGRSPQRAGGGRSDPVAGGGRRSRRGGRSPCRSACRRGYRSGWAGGRCAIAGWTSTASCWWSGSVARRGPGGRRWSCSPGGGRRRTVEPARRRPSRIGSPGSVPRLPRPSACTWPSTGHRPRWPAAGRSRSGVWPSR